jgi:uncharacterized iron-regulated membrane protein
MRIRKIAGRLHLALGLATGLVFALVCLSGALVAFTEEALNVANRKHIKVVPQEGPRKPVEAILEKYRQAYPNEQVFVFNAYREKDRSYDFFSAVLKPGSKNEYGGYKMVYADPYTGEILHVDKGTLEIIVLVVTLHTTLLMGEFGHGLIKACTLIFLVQLIAGLVLWRPRNRAAFKAALQWAWRSGPRRRLFDGHRTVGFYASAGLLVMVLTSLVMSWTWVSKPVVAAFGGEPSLVHGEEEEPPARKRRPGADFSLDSLARSAWTADAHVNQATFLLPLHDTVGTLTLRTHSASTFLNFAVGSPTEYDRVTGEPMAGAEAEGEARNDRIFATNLLIHMGFWGGTPTKILYFILGIAGASLPVTGFFLWRGKRRRRRLNPGANPSGLEDPESEPETVHAKA